MTLMESLNGVFNIYKEAGWTSFDVVAKMRGMCHIRKAGHTGTLDPAAEGVLPVCIGKATRIVQFLSDQTKTYEAVLLLGRQTDTLDQTGTTVGEADPQTLAQITEEQVREATAHFAASGGYMQIPPMYSAKHHGGRRLYELAREGVEVEREALFVRIDEIRIIGIRLPEVTISVTCGKGTYIRCLCADIGDRLGCGAVMTRLVRKRVGPFKESQALTVSQLQKLADEGALKQALILVDRVFGDKPAAHVDSAFEKPALNGNKLPYDALRFEGLREPEGLFRLYDTEGAFIGLYRREDDGVTVRPVKMFL